MLTKCMNGGIFVEYAYCLTDTTQWGRGPLSLSHPEKNSSSNAAVSIHINGPILSQGLMQTPYLLWKEITLAILCAETDWIGCQCAGSPHFFHATGPWWMGVGQKV
jgi:hypothetical protein